MPVDAAWPGVAAVSKAGLLTLAAAAERAADSPDTAPLLIHGLATGSAWSAVVALLTDDSVLMLAIGCGPSLSIFSLQQIATMNIGDLHLCQHMHGGIGNCC